MSVDSLSAQQPPASPPSRNRSILSKFTTHFGNRNRNISDFYIQPDDPWKTYFPGDVIKGTVVLTVVKPVRITHLVLCLHGFVKVFKNTVSPGEIPQDLGFLGPGRGRRGGEYLGNGFATLFEDETVLCGDGRLKEGIYKFQFEMEFPPYGLPSSISFERGTISYMLTATLTRPTTISPTMSCHKRINLVENIDIAPFPAPKPRVVTLEPVSKRSKARSKCKNQSGDQVQDPPPHDPSLNGTVAGDHRPPLSPAPSDVSSSSRLSNSSQSFQIVSDPSSTNAASLRNSEARSSTTSSSDHRTITATTELLRAGGLPGDTLPLKITINHSKKVRSPHGIIVTLYRQGRIDMHPAIPIGPPEKGKKPVYEDCYPKSRTGLGGLSIGTIRTSSVFRKDLSQTFAPLIVDPTTMSAVVKTSVRIPEDAFPTIARVPGAMISFRYYVEVVVDLRGKLAASDRFLPRLNMVTGGSNFTPSGQVLSPPDKNGHAITSSWAGHILDTDQIRREKGVIAVEFEVVVGTRDSGRGRRQATEGMAPATRYPTAAQTVQADGGDLQGEQHVDPSQEQYMDQEYYGHGDYGYGDYAHNDYAHGDYPAYDEGYWPEYPEGRGQHFQSLGGMVQPPPPEEPVDEKTRLRRAEEMLLPSRPPDDEAGPSTAADTTPTAPHLPDEDQLYDYHASLAAPAPVSSALSVDTIVPGPSAPPPAPDGAHAPTDDKQELERRRLMMEASAPEPEPADGEAGRAADAAPTAPVLDEEDPIMDAGASPGESLPRYQR